MDNRLKILFYIAGCLNVITDADIACPAPEPCTCAPGIIDCEDRRLNNIPIFQQVSGNFHTLNLRNNSITVVPDNAFSSLNISTLLLDENDIHRVSLNAFSGVTVKIAVLNLAHNNLNTLPPAIGYLSNIKQLDVSANPIPGYTPGHAHGHGHDGLDDDTMRKLGPTLTSFSFGGSALHSWPHTLSHLNQLQELRVSGLHMANLLSGCFHGFEHTLLRLTIEHTSLFTVPLCIRDLTHLRELHLDYMNDPDQYGNINFGDDSMVSAPFDNLAGTLETLSLNHDGLTTFPENIKDLKRLRNLSLDGNNLDFVSDEAINLLKHSNVTTLSLKTCNLKRVPGAISDLQILTDLNLKGNQIRSIESTDLQDLGNLETLDISDNPLTYISDNSLCGLQNLKAMTLAKTALTELSQSFKNLVRLHTLNLQDARIDCTCDMAWVALWKQNCQRSTGLEIEGQCETIDMSINDYVLNRLQTCQDFYHLQSACNTSCTSGPPVPTHAGR